MELNWSTFTLEIINFLILIWLLKRFLYKPVLSAIQDRQRIIQQKTDDAQSLQKEAQALKNQYENRLQDWEQERQQARDALQQEMECERERRLQALKKSLDQEREKKHINEENQYREQVRKIEHQALQQGAEFATRILTSASSPQLEARLVDMVIADLDKLTHAQIESLRARWGEPSNNLQIASAYAMSNDQQQKLENSLQRVIQQPLSATYQQHPDLIAGIYISIGAWVLQANIRDDLNSFVEFAHVTR